MDITITLTDTQARRLQDRLKSANASYRPGSTDHAMFTQINAQLPLPALYADDDNQK